MAEVTQHKKKVVIKKDSEFLHNDKLAVMDTKDLSTPCELMNANGACGFVEQNDQGELSITMYDDTPLIVNNSGQYSNIKINSTGSVKLTGNSCCENLSIHAAKLYLDGEITVANTFNVKAGRVEQKGRLDLKNAQVLVQAQSLSSYGDVQLGDLAQLSLDSLYLKGQARLSSVACKHAQSVLNVAKAIVVGAQATLDCEYTDINTNEVRIIGKGMIANCNLNAEQLKVRSRAAGQMPAFYVNGSNIKVKRCEYKGSVSMLCSELSCDELLVDKIFEAINSGVTVSGRATNQESARLTLEYQSTLACHEFAVHGDVALFGQSQLDCDALSLANKLLVDNSNVTIVDSVQVLDESARLVVRNNSTMHANDGLLDGYVYIDHSSLKAANMNSFAKLVMQNGALTIEQLTTNSGSTTSVNGSQVDVNTLQLNGAALLQQCILDNKVLFASGPGATMIDSIVKSEDMDIDTDITIDGCSVDTGRLTVSKKIDANASQIKTNITLLSNEAKGVFQNTQLDSDLTLLGGDNLFNASLVNGHNLYIKGKTDSQKTELNTDTVMIDESGAAMFTDSLVKADKTMVNQGSMVAQNSTGDGSVGLKVGDYLNAGDTTLDKASLVAEGKYASMDDSKTTIHKAQVYAKKDVDIGGELTLKDAGVKSDQSITLLSGSQAHADKAVFNAAKKFVNLSGAHIDGTAIHVKCKKFANLGTIAMKNSFQAEVDTFINSGSIDGGDMSCVKADMFFINMFGHLAGKHVDIKSALLNANIFGDIAGSDSLSMHALVNTHFAGTQRSWNLSTHGMLNLNAGINGAFILPKDPKTVFKLHSLVSLSKSILNSIFPESTNIINTIYTGATGAYTHGTHAKAIFDDFKKSEQTLGGFIKSKLSEDTGWAERVSTLLEVKDVALSTFELSHMDFSTSSDSWIPDFSSFTRFNLDGRDIGGKLFQSGLGILAPTSTRHGLFDINLGCNISGNTVTESVFSYNGGVSIALQHNSVSSHWQKNDGVLYSGFGMTNLDGHSFENNGIIGSVTQSNLRFHDLNLNDQGSVVGRHAYFQSHTAKLGGTMDVETAIFDIAQFDQTKELITGENQYANYHFKKNLTINTDEHLKIDRKIKRDCGLSVTAKGIDLDVDYHTQEDIRLTTTEDDLNISSTVRAKNIHGTSAKNIKTTGDVKAENKSVYTAEGYFLNSGGQVKSGQHTYIQAKNEIRNECVESNIQGSYDVMKQYKKGVIAGGTGEDNDGVGLTMVTDGKVINDASTIASVGDNAIIARKGMQGVARSHEYIANKRVKQSGKGPLKKKKTRITKAVQIEGNELISTNGKNRVYCEEGGADMTATRFIAKNGTDIHTRDAIKLKSLQAKTSTYKKDSTVGGLFHNTDKKSNQVSQKTLVADNGVSTFQSDQATIHAKGAEFVGKGDLHFKAKKGILLESEVLATDTKHRSSGVKLSSNVTDVGQKLLNDPASIAQMHPITNSAKKAVDTNNPLETANELYKGAQMLNDMLANGISADSLAAGMLGQSGLGDSNGIDPKVTATFSKTQTTTHSERVGAGGIDRNNVTIETQGVAVLIGLPVTVHNDMSVQAKTFIQEGIGLNSSTKTKTQSVSVGVSAMNPTSPTVGVSESKASSSSTTFINQQLNVGGNLHVEAETWNIDGANAESNTLSGQVDNLNIKSRQNIQKSKASSASLSSAGSASYAQSSSSSRTLSERSGIKVRSTQTPQDGQGFVAKKTDLTSADIETAGSEQFRTGQLTTHELVDEVKTSQFGMSASMGGSGSKMAIKGSQFSSKDKVLQKCYLSEAGGKTPQVGVVKGDFVTNENEKTQHLSHSETPRVLQSFDFSLPLPQRDNGSLQAPSVVEGEAQKPVYESDSDTDQTATDEMLTQLYDAIDPMANLDTTPSNSEVGTPFKRPIQDEAKTNLNNKTESAPVMVIDDDQLGEKSFDFDVDYLRGELNVKPVVEPPFMAANYDDDRSGNNQKHDAIESDKENEYEYRPMAKVADAENIAMGVLTQATGSSELGKHVGRYGTALTFFANYDEAIAEDSDTPFVDATVTTGVDIAMSESIAYVAGGPVALSIDAVVMVGKVQQEYELYSVSSDDIVNGEKKIQQAREDGNTRLAVASIMTQDARAQIQAMEQLPIYVAQGADKAKELVVKGLKKTGNAVAYAQCVNANAQQSAFFVPAKFQVDCEKTYLSDNDQSNKAGIKGNNSLVKP